MSAITEWITEVAQIRERVLNDRITSLDDPRAQQIIESDHYPMDDGGANLAQYFGDDEHSLEHLWFWHFTEIPPSPLPLPYWAKTSRVLLGSWPEIEIHFGTEVAIAELNITVEISRTDYVFAEAVDDRNGQHHHAGKVITDERPQLVIGNYHGRCAVDFTDSLDLHVLGEAILDLARMVQAQEVPNVVHGS